LTRKKKETTTDLPAAAEVSKTKTETAKVNETMSTTIDDGIFEFDEDISTAEPPPPFPNGIYDAEIVAVAVQNSKSSGNRMWVPEVLIPTDEYPKDYPAEEEPDGIRLRTYITVGAPDRPSSAREKVRARRFCEAAGVTPSSSINMTDFMGKAVRVEVEGEVYEGEMRPRIKRILPAK
jgi:hypothetical protein